MRTSKKRRFRVHELANKYGTDQTIVLSILQKLGFPVRTHLSTVGDAGDEALWLIYLLSLELERSSDCNEDGSAL